MAKSINSRKPAAKTAVKRSRPGTAVQPKGQHRAEEILLAARAVLVEEGYPALTTRKVAQRVGIRQSNVQYYFPAKADLVRALFETAIASNLQALTRKMESGRMTPKRRLVWTLDRFLASHADIEEQVFLRELWALSAHDPDVADVMNRFYERWVDAATESILKVNPEMDLRKAQRRALIIISMVDGLSLFHGAAGINHPAVRGIEKEVREVVLALAGGGG